MNSDQVDNTSSAFDHELNEALANANIADGYEQFLAIFDRFFAEEIEVASDGHSTGLVGKARLLPVLINFFAPLHVMAEIGGLAVTLRYSPIRSDKRGEQHTEWSLDRSICSEFSEDGFGGRVLTSSTSVITNIAKSEKRRLSLIFTSLRLHSGSQLQPGHREQRGRPDSKGNLND